ncbi:MAG TPA: DUF2243 domain-containing protein [Kofleriaceae bacterium]|nr:DUF2243 domain-containing protein [Kofleriaceae bacterium]
MLLDSTFVAAACPDCPIGREARAMVLADAFWTHAWYAVVPFLVATGAVAWFARGRVTPLVAAGLVLGIGLGGFVDGILLHQILQWHNMLSSHRPPVDLVAMKYNMVWDGLFHALTWTLCATGIALLFRAARRPEVPWSGRTLVGSMLGGWGLFNLVEGLIDHQLLGIHHVHPGDAQLAWDLGFVSLGGVGLMLLGYVIARAVPRPATRGTHARHAPAR